MILWLIYILIDAIVNWYIIEKKKTVPNYIQLTIIRGMATIPTGISVPVEEWTIGYWYVFTACSFWVLFDILINLFRGKSIFYRGENSKIDQFGNKLPALYFLLKIGAVVGAVWAGLNLLE